jgi:PAS domain S-box-containing protein
MATVGFTAGGLSLWSLYTTAFEQERSRLMEITRSQARLIEAVARFDATHSQDANPRGAIAATLDQVIDAHARYKGFGETGEFTLARREGDDIVFLLSFRHENPGVQRRLPFRGDLAEPMRRALEGTSGSLVGLDYRGVRVLAAHEPVAGLDAGIVAKIDLVEIRAPFIKAGSFSLGGALMIVLLGTVLFFHFGSPLVERLESTVAILRNAQRIAHFGNWEWDIKRNSLWWSDEVYRVYGLDPERFSPSYESYLSAVHPEDRERVRATANTSLKDRLPYSIEYRIVLPDSRERFVQEQAETFVDKAGNPLRMTGTVQDISERKAAELALLDSERLAREQLESRVRERTRDLTLLNEDLHSEVEERKRAQEGLSRGLLYQEIIASILKLSLEPVPLVEILRRSLILVLQGHELGLSLQGCIFLVDENTKELVMKVRHGLPASIVDSCGRLPFGRCLCGMAAQSRKVIHADRIDERHEHSYTGIDPHGHYCVPIQAGSELFGVLNLYVPEGHQQTEEEVQFVLAVANTIAGVIRRRRAEEALRASETKLAEAQRVAHLGSWDWDIVDDDLSWSAETYRIFDVAPEQFGATYEAFLEFVHPTDRETVKKAVDAALYRRQSYSVEHRLVQPDGTERVVHEQAQVSFDADGQPLRMVGTVQDVTEEKRAKEALRKLKEELEKKERNRLAALLHDGVGQSLQAVNLGLKMIAGKRDQPVAAEILPELVEEVRKAIAQVRDLTQELRPTHLEQMDLAEAMRSHASKLGGRINAEIRIYTDQATYAFLSDRIKEHCFLIFQEVLNNAIKHSSAEQIKVRLDAVDDAWLLMEISDNGCGFCPEQILAQDKGLGLSIIKERSQRLGGTTEICSEPGKGTTVMVKVPIS